MALPRDLAGATVDLTPFADKLEGTRGFKAMTIEAAKRKLRKRGAKEVIEPFLPE